MPFEFNNIILFISIRVFSRDNCIEDYCGLK